MPVEHAQVLVLLFHTVSLMPKKVIMMETVNALVSQKLDQVKSLAQLKGLARLLMFFDYFLRQLYEPTTSLVSLVEYNLFGVKAGSPIMDR